MPAGRAPKGGVFAVNGEFYEGGKFLPSTNTPKGTATSYVQNGKREIEPGVWAVYSGELARDEKADGFYKLISADAILQRRHYGQSDEEIETELEPYRAAWTQGKRWRIFRKGSSEVIRFE